ncbi:MAG: glycosyltransferase [Luteitalea sp.]|nr:glycosyltransferase [Luteitalea sp.]
MRVLVVVPTYNERENLPILVRAIMVHEGYRVLVVDDGSPDGTGAVADALAAEFKSRVAVLHRTGKRGLGRSYIEGLQRAMQEEVDVICQMDADLSHDPRYLPDLVRALGNGYDLVLGSRYMHGVSVVNWPLRRLILSTAANWYIRTVTRLPLRDCTTGYRCWRREALGRVPLDRIVSDGYAFIFETLYEAVRRGCRVGEVPIIFVERREGESKLSTSVLFESLLMPWRVLFRRRE